MEEEVKPVIYQLFVRLFGNTKEPLVQNGTIEENGSGKFNDINDAALSSLKSFGVSHIWLTGVLEHATMTDFTAFGIQPDDWRLVKGRAGSPFAVKDYFDVSPELAVNVNDRMNEFISLVDRIHNHGMRVLIDFIPNHVARSYHSESEDGQRNFFGAYDDTEKMFHPQNNFYYLLNETFFPPADYEPLGRKYPDDMISHVEIPARVTGNNVLSANPSTNDWFETVKLNFGIDIFNDHQTYFDPVPRTWMFLKEVLMFWSKTGVDGFRCDMAEMVPAEFWKWLIPQFNNEKMFIAEVYEYDLYNKYIYEAGFDYLYDKAGLYDTLIKVLKEEIPAHHISNVVRNDIGNHLLNFMENHDELRLASSHLCKGAWTGFPAVVVSATISKGPFMIYNGQECGETAMEQAGFGGGNGRTTIYDYWNMPELQKWVNDGKYDGGKLNSSQQHLRKMYGILLNLIRSNSTFTSGDLYILTSEVTSKEFQSFDQYIYSYLRHSEGRAYMIVVNFSKDHYIPVDIQFDREMWNSLTGNDSGHYEACELFSGKVIPFNSINDNLWMEPLSIVIPLSGAMIYEIRKIKD